MTKKTFGYRLKLTRESKKMSKKHLSESAQVVYKNVQRWEKDTFLPNITVVTRLAQALDVSTDYLAGLEESVDSDPLLGLLAKKLDGMSAEKKKALKTILMAF